MRKLALAIAVASLAAPAFAQQPPVMGDLDTDKNGSLSVEELTAGMPDMTKEQMATYDVDHDGALNQEEFDKMMLAHK